MSIKKYIKTKEVVGLTRCPYNEILNLVNSGVLPGHKTRRGRWLLNVDAVEKHFGIRINKPEEDSEEQVALANNKTRLIINEEHYEEVIQRICAAKSPL